MLVKVGGQVNIESVVLIQPQHKGGAFKVLAKG
jgi:hypothetical protein